ncbi:hypothetical protein RFI_36497 [Reticulomyxa filosa]|uniref:Transmembrane protein n=1 Tax=Reticulomyxa filosa TaxID=46433 RepID=X6LG48_RETFI|nr:hypothetical protein RFI_36497 [Reticulomyxa filosa]|eukprot:ETO00943.1 hypothetical protein RFI_36497 [Reticulomyxa filosa]
MLNEKMIELLSDHFVKTTEKERNTLNHLLLNVLFEKNALIYMINIFNITKTIYFLLKNEHYKFIELYNKGFQINVYIEHLCSTNSTLFQTFQKTLDVNCFLSLLLFKKYWKKECKQQLQKKCNSFQYIIINLNNAYFFVATAILTLITLEWYPSLFFCY